MARFEESRIKTERTDGTGRTSGTGRTGGRRTARRAGGEGVAGGREISFGIIRMFRS